MKIAITSRIFFPSVGGVPVIVRLLANAWMSMGHEVRLLTSTAAHGAESPEDTFPIIRHPSNADLLAAARWCDVVFQMEVSMKMIWPFVLLRRRCFINHQTHFVIGAPVPLYRRLQGWMAACAHPVACSQAIRRSWGGHGIVIGNPYDDRVFHLPAPDAPRPHQLLFVGRLVSDKGLDVLLHALDILRSSRGLRPELRVVGDELNGNGSVLPEWRQKAASLGMEQQVTFLGSRDSVQIAAEMRHAQFLVVPSTWPEPFGIVALEGLASGCHVIASSGGGLPDAGGSFASYFENGNAADLARVLGEVLASPVRAEDEAALAAHLERHHASAVASRFLSHFQSVPGCSASHTPILAS